MKALPILPAGPMLAFLGFLPGALAAQGVCRARPDTAGVVNRDSAGVRIVENWTPAAAPSFDLRVVGQPTLTIGERDAQDEVFVRIAGATRLSTGAIVVGDAGPNDVRVFDATGRFVRRIGRAGQGPGEYQNVTSVLRLGGDTVVVSDYLAHRLTYFRADGSVINTRPFVAVPSPRNPRSSPAVRTRGLLRVEVRNRYADGSFLASARLPNFGQNPPVFPRVTHHVEAVYHLDRNLARLDSVAAHVQASAYTRENPTNPGVGTLADMPFAPAGSIAARSDGFYQTDGVRYEIRQHAAAGRVVGIIRLCREPVPVTAPDIARWRAAFLAPALPRALEMLTETARQVPHPKLKPALTELHVDALGRLWAGEFAFDSAGLAHRAPYTAGPMKWYVFDPTGRFLGSVETPPGLNIFEIGRDYLLGRHIAEDHVQSIRQYSIRTVRP